MEVQYTGLAPATQTINLTEEDMAALYDIVADYFLAILPYTDLNDRACKYDQPREALRAFAEKFGVSFAHGPSIEAFYRACLGKVKKDGE